MAILQLRDIGRTSTTVVFRGRRRVGTAGRNGGSPFGLDGPTGPDGADPAGERSRVVHSGVMDTDATDEGRPDLPSTELRAIVGFDGYPIEANQALRAQSGWTGDELAAVSWWELLHPDDQHAAVEDVERLMVTGGSLERELRVVRRAGNWLRVATTLECPEPGCEQVEIRGVALGAADEPPALADMWRWSVGTGRLQLRAELAVMIGGDGTGADHEQWIEHVHPADRARVQRVAETWAAAGEAHSEDYRIVTPDGLVRWWHVAGRAHPAASGRVEVVRGFIRDITDARLGSA